MKAKTILTTIIIGFSLSVLAQDKPTKVKCGMPEILKPNQEGTYKASDLAREFQPGSKWGTKKMSKRYWYAWSDRANNPVYIDAQSNTKASRTLDFGERVIIADVVGDRAYVYTDDEGNVTFPTISSRAKMIGWVSMDNLLLWERCPTDDLGVQQKALIAIHLNELRAAGNYEKAYYMTPTDHSNPNNLIMDMKFYFIMKESDKHALLCENPTLLPNGGNLKGWVEASNYTAWGQRACLEPNWDIEYNERNKGKEVGVYQGPSHAAGSKILSFKYGNSNGDTDPTSQYRLYPDLLRFPILKDGRNNDKYVRCTTFANYHTRNLDVYDTRVNSDIDAIRKKKRQMNLIFVIESMSGMGEYLEAVKTSLSKCGMYADQGLTVQAGLVLYRNEGSDNSLETVKLSNTDDARLLSMLNNSQATGRWPNNKREVALKQALEAATDPIRMGFSKDHSNLVVVIGNNGAEQAENLADANLLKKLIECHIQLMSIQVVTSGSGSPAWYYDQMEGLIKKNMDKQYQDIGDKYNFNMLPNKDGFTFTSIKNKDNVLFSQLRFPAQDGGKLTGKDVTKYVDNGIYRYAKTISNWSKHYERALSGFDDDFLKAFLGESKFSAWKKNSDISAFDGFVPLKDVDEENYWHYIVYLSRDELYDLLDKLKPTYNAAKELNDDRKAYIAAIRTLAQQLTGQQDDKEIENMSIDELQRLIYGLDVRTEATSRKIDEIKDASRVRKPEYLKILRSFVTKYDELYQLYQSNYRYRAKYGSDYYYWIPIEDLP